jgi:predicted DNA-binding transcriptional regulator AlpA
MKKYVSDKLLAERYGVSRSTIWRWVAKGIIPKAHKLGPGTSRFDLVEVEAAEVRRETGAA